MVGCTWLNVFQTINTIWIHKHCLYYITMSLAIRVTLAPCWTAWTAKAFPIPLEPPVIWGRMSKGGMLYPRKKVTVWHYCIIKKKKICLLVNNMLKVTNWWISYISILERKSVWQYIFKMKVTVWQYISAKKITAWQHIFKKKVTGS